MRVLHLIDEGAPAERAVIGGVRPVLHACRLLHQRTRHAHEVCIIGGAALEAEARALGLNVAGRIQPRLGNPRLAWRALARLASDRRPSIVQCWSTALARLAGRAFSGPPTPGISATLLSPPPGRPDAAHAAVGDLRTAAVTVCCDAGRDEWIGAGVEPDRITVVPPPVAPPAPADERQRLRRGLGLAPGEIAVILLGPAPHADVVRWVFFHGILGMAGVRFTGVVTREAGQFDRGVRYFLSAPAKNRLIVSEHSAASLLPAMDAGVFEGGGYGPTSGIPARPAVATMPIALAHGAGVPVIAPRWAADPRLYPAEASAPLLGRNATLPELARVVMELFDAPGLLAAAGRAVREHMARQDHASAFARAIDAAWTGGDHGPDAPIPTVAARRARTGAAL